MRRIGVWLGDWLCRFLRVLFDFLIVVFPLERTPVLADLLGRIILFRKQKPSTARVSLVLGNFIPPNQIQGIWTGYRRHVGMTLLEIAKMEVMSADELRHFTRMNGEEHLRAALERKRGTTLLFNHFANMLCIAAGLGIRGYDTNVVANPMLFPSLEKRSDLLFENLRANRLLTGNGLYFDASRVLKRNAIFASAFDYSVRTKRSKHGIWIPFGNAEILVNPGPVIVALRLGAPILFMTCKRHDEGGYQLLIHPEVQYESSPDFIPVARTIIQQGLALLMDDIRNSPSAWWIWDNVPLRKKLISPDAHSAREAIMETSPAYPTG